MTTYEPQTWTSHEIIHSNDLNKMEDGIAAAHSEIADIVTELESNAYVNRTYTASNVAISANGNSHEFADIDVSAGSLVTVLIRNVGLSTNLTINIYGTLYTEPYTTDPIISSSILAANKTIEIYPPTPQDKIKVVVINNDVTHDTAIDLVVRTLGNYDFMDNTRYDPDVDGKVENADYADSALKLDDGESGKTYDAVMIDVADAISVHAIDATAHHTNQYDPSASEKLALAGTSGTPGSDNKYVTDSDPRMDDARQPVAHLHAVNDISNIASVYEPIISSKQTGFNKPFGSTTDSICEGNDSRLSDSRSPTSHAVSHKTSGSDPIKLDELAAPTDTTTLDATTSTHGLLPKLIGGTNSFLRADGTWAIPTSAGSIIFGDGEGEVCEGSDSRLSDSRVPTMHATSHASGASDPIKLDDLAAPDDNTDLNASISKHGLLPKLDGDTGHFLRADGTWTEPQSVITFGTTAGTACEGNDSRLSNPRSPTSHALSHKSGQADAIRLDELHPTTDNTTLNSTTSAHGLLRKLSGSSTQFLNGNGEWTNPAGLSTTFVRWNEGSVSTSISFMPYLLTSAKTITAIKGYIATLPTGCDILVDFRKNDPSSATYSIFASDAAQAISTGLSKTNGVYQFNFTSALDAAQISLVAGDVIFIVITQVGSTLPGTGIYFEVDF